MAQRTLSMVVEGKDESAPAFSSAESSVISLGSTVDGVSSRMMTFAQHVEMGRRELEAVSSSAGSASTGLGMVATDAGAAGTAAGSAGMDMGMLTGALSFLEYGTGVSRRGVVMLTRGIRLLGTASRSSIRDLSTVSKIALGVGAAGVVGAIGLAAVVKGVINLAKSSIEAEDKRVDFEEWTADVGGHVEVLGRLREASGGLTSDLDLQEDATKAVTSATKELMAADYTLTEAQARRLALMEYDRKLIQDTIARGDRLGDTFLGMTTKVDNLGDSVGQNLTPALDAASEPIDDLVTQTGPAFETWASSLGDWFENRIPGFVGMTIDKLGLLINTLAIMMRISATPLSWKVEALGIGAGPPMYAPGGAALPPAPYREALRDVQVSGAIDVNVNVSGDLPQVGAAIGRGIQGELQRVGME